MNSHLTRSGKSAPPLHAGGDELTDEARRILRTTTLPSVSFVQRKLHIDFDRAARIMREIEEDGLTGVPKAE
jgi:DNA segregation ATPase FtsK/SpoIIIE-like protein